MNYLNSYLVAPVLAGALAVSPVLPTLDGVVQKAEAAQAQKASKPIASQSIPAKLKRIQEYFTKVAEYQKSLEQLSLLGDSPEEADRLSRLVDKLPGTNGMFNYPTKNNPSGYVILEIKEERPEWKNPDEEDLKIPLASVVSLYEGKTGEKENPVKVFTDRGIDGIRKEPTQVPYVRTEGRDKPTYQLQPDSFKFVTDPSRDGKIGFYKCDRGECEVLLDEATPKVIKGINSEYIRIINSVSRQVSQGYRMLQAYEKAKQRAEKSEGKKEKRGIDDLTREMLKGPRQRLQQKPFIRRRMYYTGRR